MALAVWAGVMPEIATPVPEAPRACAPITSTGLAGSTPIYETMIALAGAPAAPPDTTRLGADSDAPATLEPRYTRGAPPPALSLNSSTQPAGFANAAVDERL